METLLVWGLALLGLAFVLLVIDIFVPTAGVLSVTSLCVGIAGVVCLYQHSVTWGLIGTLLLVVGAPVIFFVGLQVMPNTPIGRKLIGPSAEELEGPVPPRQAAMAKLVGQEGEVLTDLRPIGTIRIGDQRYDALSETSMVRAGSRVRVVSVEGSELKVRPV